MNKIFFTDVTEENLNEVLDLKVGEEQKAFVPDAAGILARAWSHRNDGACVHVIMYGERAAGLMFWYEMTEEPACYHLMELIVDARYQNMGIAGEAPELLKRELSQSPRYPMIELACDRKNSAALHVYERAGFVDSGYTDPDLPQFVNLVYRF